METRRAIIHFVDGTRLTLDWPQQAPADFLALRATVREAIKADQLAFEVEGNLMIIQTKSVKFVEVIPAPEKLPDGIIRNARRATE